jgi:predicted CopG family antitoxin
MRTTIKISIETKAKLDSLKHPGQSIDGIIRELIEERKKAKGERK